MVAGFRFGVRLAEATRPEVLPSRMAVRVLNQGLFFDGAGFVDGPDVEGAVAVEIDVSMSLASVVLALVTIGKSLGNASRTRTPMMTRTTMSSVRENPESSFHILWSDLICHDIGEWAG